MHKQTTFVITAALLLTAIVSAGLYTINAANAQSNMSNATSGAAKNVTSSATEAAKSAIGRATGGAKSAITGK
jgi:hypothetical protein